MEVKIKGEQYFIASAHPPDETKGEETINQWWQDFRQRALRLFETWPIVLLADADAKMSGGRNTYHGGCELENETKAARS